MRRPDVEPAFEIGDAPVFLGAFENLSEVPSLSAFQSLAKLADLYSLALGVAVKEVAGGAEFELPVVKISGDIGRDRLRPGNQPGQQTALLRSQPNELPANRQVRFVDPKALGVAARMTRAAGTAVSRLWHVGPASGTTRSRGPAGR